MRLLLVGTTVLLLSILAAIPTYAQNSSSSQNAYAVYVDGRSYVITYGITGGSVESIQANSTYSSITVMIQANSNGTLWINMPGSFVNSISFNGKSDLIMFLDGIEVFGTMTRTNCNVALEIPFQKGVKQIDIAGQVLIGGGTPTKGNSFDVAVYGGRGFNLETVANADTCDFSFDQGKKQLHIQTSGPANKEEGFFQIALPHEFLGGPYTVLAEGQPVEFKSAFSNATGKDVTTVAFQ